MRRFTASRFVFGLVANIGLLVGASGVAAQTVSSSTDPTANLNGSVRFRAFNNGNNAVRVTDDAGVASQANLGNPAVAWGASRCVRISYDGISTLTAQVANVATPCSFATPIVTVSRTTAALGVVNYLEIAITKQTSTTSILFNGVVLTPPGTPDGALGNFSLASPAAGPLVWSVSDIDLTAGFTLTGTVAITGLSGGGDSNFLEVRFGEVPPSDSEGPVTSDVSVTPMPVILNGDGTVTAIVSDAGKGDNNVASAEYSLNGGTWTPMDASDGGFNEVSEDVTATFTATELGANEVCVRGTDSVGNIGGASCQPFLVTYKFDGFFSPIETDLVNMAKAGQSVPVKWRLTDANDVPVDDPASFVNLLSYPVSCGTFSGNIADAVEEYAPGTSGLQWMGDGYWQFNWKTPKEYANTCRAMYVEFNSTALSPIVKFQFKK